MNNWYQVEVNGMKFGFAANENRVITKHPDFNWVHKTLDQYKVWLLENNAGVYFIAQSLKT